MTTKILRPLLLAVAAATLAFVSSTHAAIPPAEKLLPADTLFVLTAPDCTVLRDAANKSPQVMLWHDAAMRPFREKFMAKWNETFIAPLERDLGVKFADFSGLPQGQFTLALTINGSTGNDDVPPGLVLLLDAKDKSPTLRTNLAALTKKWTDAGRTLRTENFHGIPFSIVTLSSNDMPQTLRKIFPVRAPVQELGKETKPAKPGELYFAQFESLLIVGSSAKVIESVTAHLTGGSAPALGDDTVFAADKLSQFRDSPLYYGWFNARALFAMLAALPAPQPNPDAPTPVPPPDWKKIMAASGITGLKSASFACRESRDGSEADIYLSVPEASRTGILKMIAASSKDANPPGFVPADAAKFWRWRLDGQKTWEALQKMVGDFSPDALAKLNSALDLINMMSQQKDPNFDVRKSLIGNLGDDLISYQKAPPGGMLADLNSAPSLFLFAAANADEAALAVKNIAGLRSGQQSPPPTREFHGKKIYATPLPAGRSTPGAPAPIPRLFYCAASGGYVAMTTDISMLENYLRSAESPGKPLRETPGLADASQHVGGGSNGLFGYENQREVMRSLFTIFKNQTEADNSSLNSMALLPQGLRDWADFSLLPDYDKVSKYFFFSVFSGNTTADGLSFKAFAPRPPGLN